MPQTKVVTVPSAKTCPFSLFRLSKWPQPSSCSGHKMWSYLWVLVFLSVLTSNHTEIPAGSTLKIYSSSTYHYSLGPYLDPSPIISGLGYRNSLLWGVLVAAISLLRSVLDTVILINLKSHQVILFLKTLIFRGKAISERLFIICPPEVLLLYSQGPRWTHPLLLCSTTFTPFLAT